MLTVPYGEVPLAGARLDAVQRVLDELVARGVQGVVTLRSFPGRFCLAGDATAGYAPAGAATPVSGCALRGNPFDDALDGTPDADVPPEWARHIEVSCSS